VKLVILLLISVKVNEYITRNDCLVVRIRVMTTMHVVWFICTVSHTWQSFTCPPWQPSYVTSIVKWPQLTPPVNISDVILLLECFLRTPIDFTYVLPSYFDFVRNVYCFTPYLCLSNAVCHWVNKLLAICLSHLANVCIM